MIDDSILYVGTDQIIHEKVNFIDPNRLILFLWLFQSQSQTGTASAKPLKGHPKLLSRILAQYLLKLFSGFFGNFHDVSFSAISIYLYYT